MAPTNQQSRDAKTKSYSSSRTKQPKARVARYLKNVCAPQLVERNRSILLLKGLRCSDAMSTVLKDIRAMKAPNVKLLTKNNGIFPFEQEGEISLEFLTTKNDCSLLALASHNKKRPNNLVIGRTFDRRILDMVELGILRYKSLVDYKLAHKKRVGSKPLMFFAGEKWHLDDEFKKLQNLLVDFYRGEVVDKLVLSGMDHVMSFTVAPDPSQNKSTPGLDKAERCIVYMRTYFVKLKKHPAGGNVPAPYLEPCGPDMDFVLRRTQFAATDLFWAAMKQPKQGKISKGKHKNKTTNIFGETVGRLHVQAQDIDKMQGKRSKALKIAEREEREEEKKAVEGELEKEKDELGQEFKQTFGFEEKEAEKKSKRKR